MNEAAKTAKTANPPDSAEADHEAEAGELEELPLHDRVERLEKAYMALVGELVGRRVLPTSTKLGDFNGS